MRLFRLYATRFILSILFLGYIAGCSDSGGDNNPVAPPTGSVPAGVYIANEGNFNSGNASLSYFIPDSLRMENGVFKSVTGRDLGDIAQSLTIHDGLLYIVVNNSHKIEVLDTKDQSFVRTIELAEGASPRFIMFGPDNLGYITDLFANTVSVYDPGQNAIVETIPVGNNPEEIYYSQNHIYVANGGFGKDNTITVIELSTHTVAATLRVGDWPTAFARISSGKAAVLCAGDTRDFNDPNDDTPGMIYIIETTSRTVIDSIIIGGHPTTMAKDNNGNLYVNTENAIVRIDPSTKLVINNFINGAFYALQFDEKRNRLYATDAKDYQQPGELYVYNNAGKLLHKFTAGIIPGRMAVVE